MIQEGPTAVNQYPGKTTSQDSMNATEISPGGQPVFMYNRKAPMTLNLKPNRQSNGLKTIHVGVQDLMLFTLVRM